MKNDYDVVTTEQDVIGEVVNMIFDIIDRGISSEELAQMLGVTSRNLRRWKNGECIPRAVYYLALCELKASLEAVA